jgi:hypothetical protein
MKALYKHDDNDTIDAFYKLRDDDNEHLILSYKRNDMITINRLETKAKTDMIIKGIVIVGALFYYAFKSGDALLIKHVISQYEPYDDPRNAGYLMLQGYTGACHSLDKKIIALANTINNKYAKLGDMYICCMEGDYEGFRDNAELYRSYISRIISACASIEFYTQDAIHRNTSDNTTICMSILSQSLQYGNTILRDHLTVLMHDHIMTLDFNDGDPTESTLFTRIVHYHNDVSLIRKVCSLCKRGELLRKSAQLLYDHGLDERHRIVVYSMLCKYKDDTVDELSKKIIGDYLTELRII